MFLIRAVGTILRESGIAIDKLGLSILGTAKYEEEISGHRRIIPINSLIPSFPKDTFIAPNASVIGDVQIGPKSSIWYGSILRADLNSIIVGAGTMIGDRTVIHVSRNLNVDTPTPTIIGNLVTVGPGSILHGCTIEDEVIIGEGCIVMDGAVIEKHAKISPGTLVGMGKRIPSGQLWSGSPAKFERPLTQDEIDDVTSEAERNYNLSKSHEEALNELDKKLEELELVSMPAMEFGHPSNTSEPPTRHLK